jgi:hypothetical protein
VLHHLRAELGRRRQRIGKRFAIRKYPATPTRYRDRALANHGNRRAQRVLLLLDVPRIVEQKPNESSVLAGENDSWIHGIGIEVERRSGASRTQAAPSTPGH